MASQELTHPKLGTIQVRTHHRAKTPNIRIKAGGQIILTLPQNYTISEVLAFIDRNTPLILKKREELSTLNNTKTTAILPQSVIETNFHQIHFQAHKHTSFAIQLKEKEATIYFPESCDINSPSTQATLQQGIVQIYRREAETYLPQRTKYFAQMLHLQYHDIKIKKLRSRWGSCSSKKNLNFNLYLMKLPLELIDLVIVHELCHLKHLNHGKDFHRMLEHILPHKKELERKLKTFTIDA